MQKPVRPERERERERESEESEKDRCLLKRRVRERGGAETGRMTNEKKGEGAQKERGGQAKKTVRQND